MCSYIHCNILNDNYFQKEKDDYWPSNLKIQLCYFLSTRHFIFLQNTVISFENIGF